MSIAVLKRKTQTKYNNMSVNNDTFSLNGTMRNQGYVGQTSLSRTIVRPLRNGTALRGHGGNNRTGRETVLKQSDIFSLEDNSVVKGSTINTNGLLSKRECNSTCNTVKPDSNNNLNSAYYVIQKNKKETINCSNPEVDVSGNVVCNNNSNRKCKPKEITITKPDEAYKVMSGSSYLEKINKACTNNDDFYVPYSVKKAPFAGFN